MNSIRGNANTLFQISTFSALQQGDYEGDFSAKDFISLGNFGLGLLNKLDAGIVGKDGKFFCFTVDGKTRGLLAEEKIPYGMITYFNPEQQTLINRISNYELLGGYLNHTIKNSNLLYAIKIAGIFNTIKLRILRPQQKPYPSLEQVWAEQAIYSLNNSEGAMIGFYFPSHMKYLNMLGYHFHFITDDYQWGGHVLDVNIEQAAVDIQTINYFTLYLPQTTSFADLRFSAS